MKRKNGEPNYKPAILMRFANFWLKFKKIISPFIRKPSSIRKIMSLVQGCLTRIIIFYVKWTTESRSKLKFGIKIISEGTCLLSFKLIGLQFHHQLPSPKTLTLSGTDGQTYVWTNRSKIIIHLGGTTMEVNTF